MRPLLTGAAAFIGALLILWTVDIVLQLPGPLIPLLAGIVGFAAAVNAAKVRPSA